MVWPLFVVSVVNICSTFKWTFLFRHSKSHSMSVLYSLVIYIGRWKVSLLGFIFDLDQHWCINEKYFSLDLSCPTFFRVFFSKILLFSYFLKNYGATFLLLFHLGMLESLQIVALNTMLTSKLYCSTSFALYSAHEKCNIWTRPYFWNQMSFISSKKWGEGGGAALRFKSSHIFIVKTWQVWCSLLKEWLFSHCCFYIKPGLVGFQ